MKIAINTRFLLKNKLEGIGRFSYEVIKRLVEQHPEDEFIFFFDRPFSKDFIFAKNVIPVVLFPPARHPFLWYLWFEKAVAKALKKYKPDVFFSPDGYCCLNTNIPTLLVTHDIAHLHYPRQIPFLVRQYYNYYVPLFLKKAARISTVSNFVKQDIIQQYHIPAQKIMVAGNASQPTFQPLSIVQKAATLQRFSDGRPYFFYLGAIHPRKNIDRLIMAFDNFKQRTQSDVKLLIGGRFAWHTGAIKTAYEQSEFKADVTFLGFVSHEDLPLLLGAALALTYVSLSEGFGIPVLDAMHSEVPILTSNVSSLPEVAGKAALLVEPKSVASIADGMTKLHKNEQLRQELIQAAQQQRLKYSWENTAQKIYEALQEISKS